MACECGRTDVRKAREDWRDKRQPKMQQQPHRLIFLDETGTTTKMDRLRVRDHAPFGHWGTQTFIAGLHP